MPAQIFLIAPDHADVETFVPMLKTVLGAAEVSALMLPKGGMAENAYKTFVKAVAPVAQGAGCALLIEGEPGHVRLLGVDGLHAGASSVRDAVKALRPDMIVGAGPVTSRHEAMVLGEWDPDYIMFGSLGTPPTQELRDIARWWAETMEIPAVLCDPQADPDTANAAGCEFLALRDAVWAAPEGPAAAIAAFAKALEAAA
jgi:thiamine-phosphate pyrophosphorylase